MIRAFDISLQIVELKKNQYLHLQLKKYAKNSNVKNVERFSRNTFKKLSKQYSTSDIFQVQGPL